MPRRKGGHKSRTHAQWSASATARNWLCPGNIALAQDLIAPPSSYAADWGTACHEVAEAMLMSKPSTIRIGDRIDTDRHVFHVDQEMIDVASHYVSYIDDRLNKGFTIYAVEQQFSLDSMELGMEAGGTADCVLYNPDREELEVVDLKTGKGMVVEATGNAQARFYALGVLVGMDPDPTPVQWVRTTIVQPRYNHRDGPVRSEVLHAGELNDWIVDLAPRIATAAAALKLYGEARGNSVMMDSWADLYLNPGESQCTFCPAAGGCPALRARALEIAGYFVDDAGTHFKSNQFSQNEIEGVEADLDLLEALESWVRERRALAHEMAAQGYKFDHHKLVEKIGNRRFVGDNETETVAAIRAVIPIGDQQLYDRKLKSPAGLERAIGKAAVAQHLADLIVRPVTGTDLIRTSHTQRSPAPTLVDLFFGKET